jgi:hypothetical protein
MTLDADDRDAARAAVHEATPAGWLVVPWRVTIAALALLVSACLPQPQGPPAEFIDFMSGQAYSFTVAVPPSGIVPASEVLARHGLDAGGILPPGSAVGQPIYGLIDCIDAAMCSEDETMPQKPGQPVAVWFVPFPGTPGAASGIAWTVVDAFTNSGIISDGP